MARRNLLHRSKMENFKSWLENNYGWVIQPCKGPYEILRWSIGYEYGGQMPIIYDGSSRQHLSCNEASVPYVKRFLKEIKEKTNA